MANVALQEFIGANRDELIRRCKTKVEKRSTPPSPHTEINHGVPLFLDQLVEELRSGQSKTHEISKGATKHGRDLLLEGFTLGQVVHDYGGICQSITDLAMETNAPIGTGDFRTMNRCLDDAIAGAVTEYAREEGATRDGDSHELRKLTSAAITAFEVLREGSVGVAGSTGAVVYRSLLGIRALIDRPVAEKPKQGQEGKAPVPTRSA